MRIYIGPREISGYYANLAYGFKKIGIKCDFITFEAHNFQYGGETSTPLLILFSRYLISYCRKNHLPRFSRKFLTLLVILSRFLWSSWAILHYDVFIFGFGESLIAKNFDLPILKFLRKKVIMNFAHGSEARPPYMDGALKLENGNSPPLEYIAHRAQALKQKLFYCSNYTPLIIGSPLSTSPLSLVNFINWFSLGVPVKPIESSCRPQKFGNKIQSIQDKMPVRILHCPSHPYAKGSKQIYNAINSLKSKGHEIDFVTIQNSPHSEIIKEIQKCDFVVDQLYSDTPMATFANEAASYGKPAIVGGYGLEYLKSFVSESMWPPSKTCHPDNIEQAIEDLINDPHERNIIGMKAKEFVEKKYNPANVALNYLHVIKDDIPKGWWVNPDEIFYLEGCGQKSSHTKNLIRSIVDEFGLKSLQLSHRPLLERSIIDFACNSVNP
jgi:hypothetical protein